MKKILIPAVCVFAGILQASTVTDDFNRSDTTASTDFGTSIGSGWTNGGSTASTAHLLDNEVDVVNADAKFIALNTELSTINDGTNNEFTISATVRQDNSGTSVSSGIIFNWQDSGNYYAVRFTGTGAFQFIQVVDNGSTYARVNIADAFTHVQNRPYEITVTSTEPYKFSATIRDTVTDTIVYSNDTLEDPIKHFKDGRGGLWSSSGATCFDNFSLESTYIEQIGIDDFNRADTSATTDFAVSIGSSWTNGGSTASTARLLDNEVDVVNADTKFIAINTDIGTLNDGNTNDFVISAIVHQDNTATSVSSGIIFNWQDPGNYYAVRFTGTGAFQFIQVVDNGNTYARVNVAGAFTHIQNRPYEITVTSSEPYKFSATIRDTVTDTIVYSNDSLEDPVQHFKDGSGGLWSSSGATYFDDFSLTAIPPTDPYTNWASSFGLTGSDTDFSANPDNDQMNNLAEYCFGGDPTVEDSDIVPFCSPANYNGTNYFEIIYRRRTDAAERGLSYEVQNKADLLLSPAWSNEFTEVGTGALETGFESVTNRLVIDAEQQFGRVLIGINK